MFVGGEGDTTGLKNTQLVDLSITKTCGNLADYPLGIHDATGALVSGKPVICGGESGNHSHNFHHRECYKYDKSSNTWIFLTNMTTLLVCHLRESCLLLEALMLILGVYPLLNLSPWKEK